ncbi:MAG: OPT/YSL family transporter [Phycisphaeraceae bacterium]|nr:OPT/YSL family transporter [Phycisphaeraceae bacterium]
MSSQPSPPPGAPRPYREVTLAAIVFAMVIGLVMNASITYAGLKIGFTLGGSAIAAVLGFGVLRGLLRKGSILETNIAQTIASAVNTSNSGVIFTVPVLLLLGFTLSWNQLDFWLITLACMAGAVLGAAFIIPLRKQMIEIERLRFPSAMGVAAILKSPGAGTKKSIVLLAGIALSALIYLPVGLPGIRLPASLDRLDSLVERERVSTADAERTRMIAGWIERQSAPDDVLALGRVEAELLDAIEADEPDETAIAALRASVRDAAVTDVSPRLAHAALLASLGEKPWDSLRKIDLGWAGSPLPGYQDLNIRLPAHRDPDGKLPAKVDHNGDDRPDLVLTDDRISLGRILGLPDEYQLVFAIAPFALGAGFITGRAGLMVLAGGILAYFVLTPIAFRLGWMPASITPATAPGYGFGAFNRPLGIGLLLGGAMMGIIAALPAMRAALKSIAVASRMPRGSRDELGLKVLLAAIAGALLLLFVAADFEGNRPLNEGKPCPVSGLKVSDEVEPATYKGYLIRFASEEAAEAWKSAGAWTTETPSGETITVVWGDAQKDKYLASMNARPGALAALHPHLRAAVIAIVGALWIWFAGIIIAQCTGMTDWSPISGMALLTVVIVMLLAGTGAVLSAVLLGAALCVAITLAADMMADLRTGHLVGARPVKQQILELCVVPIGPVVCMFTVLLIAAVNIKTYGVALGPETPTSAPQAQALQAIITGVQGGEIPFALYGCGALLGALLGLGAFSGLGVLVGLSMYLPFFYIATYGIGCLANMTLAKVKGRAWAEEWGVPFCAGLIVGESVLQLAINCVVLALG